MSVSPSLNTEDFVNRVDQAQRLDRTTTASAKQIVLYSILQWKRLRCYWKQYLL